LHRGFFLTFEFGKVFDLPRKIQIMKKLFLLFLVGTFSLATFAQEPTTETALHQKQVPSVKLVDMKGKAINTAELTANGPVIISFWATWCAPCKKELNTIHEVYEDWVTETGVTLVAVAIDDEKTKSQVPVYVNGKAWDYTVLMDPNWDFKRAMGVNNVPHTFLVDKNGFIVYSHNNYAPGDEEKLHQELLKLSEK
jgi:cytochrome c biogenesis protein CcmG, thiol:disulfide interchange protein DsbE